MECLVKLGINRRPSREDSGMKYEIDIYFPALLDSIPNSENKAAHSDSRLMKLRNSKSMAM